MQVCRPGELQLQGVKRVSGLPTDNRDEQTTDQGQNQRGILKRRGQKWRGIEVLSLETAGVVLEGRRKASEASQNDHCAYRVKQ